MDRQGTIISSSNLVAHLVKKHYDLEVSEDLTKDVIKTEFNMKYKKH